jgi:endonuclease YncB( thermonuclease family)
VDVDGEQITVRYLGIDAPTGDACYAAEATAANAGLVEGQTVTLERQSVDTNARGVWVRDVWVTNADGNQVLVSQALVSQGAATSNVSEPNSRYAGWLNSTEQGAQQNGTGLWGICGD